MRMALLFVAAAIVPALAPPGDSPQPVRAKRQLPIVVEARPIREAFVIGEPIAVEITVTNNLPGEVAVHGYQLEPNEWNGETGTATPEDVYRDGVMLNQLIGRPEVKPPRRIAGVSAYRIKPGQPLKIVLHLDKWTLTGGWTAGTYDVTLRVNQVNIDDYAFAMIRADPVRVVVKAK